MNELDLILSTANTQNTPEWKDSRVGSFTSSQIYKLLTSSRKKGEVFGDQAKSYIYTRAAERLSGLDSDTFEGSYATDWGNEHEDEAAKEFERITGLKTSNAPYLMKGEYYGGSPDRYVDNGWLLEIKCPYNIGYFIKASTGFVDPKYTAQNQSNLNITGRKGVYHCTYDPRMPEGHRMIITEQPRDEEMIEKINERVQLANEMVDELLNNIG